MKNETHPKVAKLDQLIEENNMEKKGVINELGITEVTYYTWVRGENMPNEENLEKIKKKIDKLETVKSMW